MIKRILISLIAISTLAACVSLGGLSLFTEHVDNGSNTFTSGSVDISTNPADTFFTAENMAPGDSETDTLTVSNDGNNEMRYAMTTVATNLDSLSLRDELNLTIKEKGAHACSVFDGTQIYPVGADPDPDSLANGYLGSSDQGSDTGDRTLAAHASEDLCFRVTLPIDSILEDAETTATFTFWAEQTANNP